MSHRIILLQILTPSQSATDLSEGSGLLDFSRIEYTIDSSGTDQDEMMYLCLQFGKGTNPVLEYPRLPFTLVGVRGEKDESEFPDALTVCQNMDEIGKLILFFMV